MTIKPLDNLPFVCPRAFKVKSNDLEAVMHACDKHVILSPYVRVPFDSPDTSPNICIGEWHERFASVEKVNSFIIAVGICEGNSQLARVETTDLPTAIRCSTCG